MGITLTVLAAVMIIAAAGLGLLFRSAQHETLASPEYQEKMADLNASHEREHVVIEQAPWIGTTGLDEETERELPKYLRREFGESLIEEGSLKAADLTYLGRFPAAHGFTHFWRVPSSEPDVFAYVEEHADGPGLMAWGNRKPPNAAAVPLSSSPDQ